jgi:glutamate formiminotransferase
MDDCIALAHEAGELIWRRFGIPAYFYEQAALIPGRRALQHVRRPGLDGQPPDFGDTAGHPTAGATCVGARQFLVAYNIELNAADADVAKAIARVIRESSGGMPCVKALGLYLEGPQRAQVSMNLTDFNQIDFDALYSTIEREAARLGTSIAESELIGFIPQAAYDKAPEFFNRTRGFNAARIVEVRIEQLLHSRV